MTTITLPSPASAERNQILNDRVLRNQKLSRLYERRAALDDVIRTLENYQRCKQGRSADLLQFVSAVRKCS